MELMWLSLRMKVFEWEINWTLITPVLDTITNMWTDNHEWYKGVLNQNIITLGNYFMYIYTLQIKKLNYFTTFCFWTICGAVFWRERGREEGTVFVFHTWTRSWSICLSASLISGRQTHDRSNCNYILSSPVLAMACVHHWWVFPGPVSGSK